MSDLADRCRWIGVDWGTSNLRIWAMDAAGQMLGERRSDKGMGTLTRAEFEPAFLDLAGDLLPEGRVTPVWVCGMAGARTGWAEAGYRPVSTRALPDAAPIPLDGTDSRIRVRILPGISQDNPPDVMRGEETQIAGYLAGAPEFTGVICLPGTHSKWVQIEGGDVFHFASFMTGEIYDLLAHKSVLRLTLDDMDWSDEAFRSGIDDALARPERVSGYLFAMRAGALLNGASPDVGPARLSGLLIGAELAAARPYWLGQEVVLIGAGRLAEIYRAALGHAGLDARIADGAEMALAGLRAAADAFDKGD
ncbi:2-dehydro-3-deoxygalactonokinase [Oceanomicrobium pacificus]|uniref:2-keto-3-deoxy-galactonokinase n=1 Tax=Oceanomicrobium pacificus TaxID=2692916 RepID=A0A6B0TSC5_9RHOB|nr:2-dehydro-3-deoxygalactonokinase [Oceanomicrobium pacificus]MXU64102.1 2-keto-3-deoxy-galactonokinase [Oceanomicrobium pacificus]